ncbi:MAG: S-layer homology domain-containing protein, partial [Anaerotignum sp.]
MKRIICMILAAVLLCATVPQMAFAADFATASQTVKALGILSDTSTATATRGEFAKMLVSASAYKEEVGEEGVSALYPDVPKSHWASEYIRVAVEKGWMTGSVNGNFRVNDGVRVEEAAASLLELLGYDPASLAGVFPYAQISKAKSLGLADGISFNKGEMLTKQDCVYLFYNLMNAKTASGQTYAATLGYSMSGDTINYSAVVSEDLKGPFVLEKDGGLSYVLPFSIGAVYRNGVASTAAEAKAYDVYYYNEGMQTVWLYSNHVTGTYTAASPNAVAPETATVAGSTYQLEAAAAYKLSTLGEYKIGDIVTLLIGMDGTAVDVVSTSEYSGSYVGIVTSVGVSSYTNEVGAGAVDEVVYVTCTDGTTRTFTTDADLEKGNLVSITFSGGEHKVKKLSKRTLSGTVSKDGTKIGSRKFADDVKIINVSQDGS